jgi:hypothetical protein
VAGSDDGVDPARLRVRAGRGRRDGHARMGRDRSRARCLPASFRRPWR